MKITKEMVLLMKELPAETRAEVLSTLRAEWCSCCGEELPEDGECCE